MRYYDDETNYLFDYTNIVNNADFEDFLEEDFEEGIYEEDDTAEWINSYNSVEEEIIDD